MVKYVKADMSVKPIKASANSYNTPTNDVQSMAYQRAKKLYKQHKVLIDRLADR